MSTLTFPARQGDGTIAVHFGPYGFDWYIRFVQVHWTRRAGSGTDVAEIKLSLTHLNQDNDVDIHCVAGVGVGTDYNFRIWDQKLKAFLIGSRQRLSIDWTTPDSDDIAWGISVGYERGT